MSWWRMFRGGGVAPRRLGISARGHYSIPVLEETGGFIATGKVVLGEPVERVLHALDLTFASIEEASARSRADAIRRVYKKRYTDYQEFTGT